MVHSDKPHSGEACDHHHHDASAHRMTDGRRLTIALVVIGVFALVEIVGGVISNSLALIADAGHMVTDFAAIALALWARWLAARPSRDEFTYGLKRAQILAAFVNALALFVLIIWLVAESIHRLQNPGEILTGTMLVIAILGLAANLVAFRALHGGGNDLNMRGATLHVMGDILGSVAAICAALVIRFTGWVTIDPLLTMLVCVLIARSAWHLLKESTHVLMQGAPRNLKIGEIGEALRRKFPAIVEVHDVNAWMLTQETTHLSMHVVVKEPGEQFALLADLKTFLRDTFDVTETTLQIEKAGNCPDNVSSIERPSAGGTTKLTVHDREEPLAS